MAPAPTAEPDQHSTTSLFASIPTAISAFASGSFIIVLDSPSRENEGDLIILASALTAPKASFLIAHSSGYICAPMRASRADALGLPPMVAVSESTDPHRTAYTITVDANSSTGTTGISAVDRAETCRLLADGGARPGDFRRPGHVVPLRAREGLVRVRQGHTEAAVEFARLSGKEEGEQVGVIAELVQQGEEEVAEDGTLRAERSGTGMMRRDECLAFGKKYGIPVVTIEALVDHLNETEPLANGK